LLRFHYFADDFFAYYFRYCFIDSFSPRRAFFHYFIFIRRHFAADAIFMPPFLCCR